MAALNRASLEQSPLADLHALASELGLEGYRRLRKSDLVGALLESQGIADAGPVADAGAQEPETELDLALEDETAQDEDGAATRRPRSRSGGGRGRRGTSRATPAEEAEEEPAAPPASEEIVEGVVDLLGNGSGFLRLSPPGPSDDDVYISAAQVRRCELVSGDRVSGPVRPPRRSERYPSLVRIDTIGGKPAEEVTQGTRFEDLPCEYPTEHLPLDGADPTLKAIDGLAPIGKGSRVLICGEAHSGKTEALRRIALSLKAAGTDEVSLVVAGVRPEELEEWKAADLEPVALTSSAASAEAQTQAITTCLDSAKRVAARGGNPIVLIDTLDGLSTATARRLLGTGRNLSEAGSLTVIATAGAPLGGETTLITMDAALARAEAFPALTAGRTGTLHTHLLVGKRRATTIRKSRG